MRSTRCLETWASCTLACALLLAPPLAAEPQCQAVEGSWSPTYDWHVQINRGVHPNAPMGVTPAPKPCDHFYALDPEHVQNGAGEFVHAALIPTGGFRGCVVLWRKEKVADPDYPACLQDENPDNDCGPCVPAPHATTYFFDPGMPSLLIELDQDLESDIFCSGQSWDEYGQLVVAGGIPFQGENELYPDQSYRLRPAKMNAGIHWVTWGGQGYPRVTLALDPEQRPWTQLGDMAIRRYYPSLLPLLDLDLAYSVGYVPPAGSPSTIAAGSTLVLGGPWDGAGGGNEFWEVLEGDTTSISTDPTDWRDPLIPADPTTTDPVYNRPNSPNYGPNGGQFTPSHPDGFTRPDHPAEPTDPLLDSYPRAYAVSNAEVFATGDVGEATNAPGTTWVIGPREPGAADAAWTLRPGPIVIPPPSGQGLWHDSFYDTGVLLHQTGRPDRILMLGGSRNDPITDWTVNDRVWEFARSGVSGEEITSGTWTAKPPPSIVGPCSDPAFTPFERLYGNAVVLPTGRIFLEGGSKNDDFGGHCATCPEHTASTPNHDPTDPNFVPLIYDPGADEADGGTVWCMPPNQPHQTSNDVGTGSASSPTESAARLYHHVSVLLPDGRVLVAGGQERKGEHGPEPFAHADPRFTGEVFSPPYLDPDLGLDRPTVVTAPANITFGTVFPLRATHDADAPIDAVVLIRPAAITHHWDNDQRYIELAFTKTTVNTTTDDLEFTTPARELAPPGWYMLFVVQDDGCALIGHRVPSVAHWVNLQ